ncbi:MAG: DNA-formamidopyrimidine glycosylase [Anaerolineales bacterium]|nr:DNA-formamidopyrimidine glycosylase [Anaerolineales bacterium]
MPELPEVETITRALRDGGRGGLSVLRQTILKAHVEWKRVVAVPDSVKLQEEISGQQILQITRRAKYIHFRLTDYSLLFHLRMSGDLLSLSSSDEIPSHVRIYFDLSGGHRLVFRDIRKFGRVWLLEDPEQELGKLGPEPLDESLTPEIFHDRISSRKRQLKPLLMDQSFLAGMGNIYTDESLFFAGLFPLTPSDRLTDAQSALLLESIRKVLNEGIERQGSSIDWMYQGGDFQNYLHVYGRKGEKCKYCGSEIIRITVGQRGTHFCPVCQPGPE